MTSDHRPTGDATLREQVPQVLFSRVGTTLFYRPADPGPGERLWFLHWRADDPRPTLALGETWSESGTPPAVGYFVFFDVLPPDGAAADVEALLRAIWTTPPLASGFAWAHYHPQSTPLVTVAARLALTLDEAARPTVEADTPFPLPPGQLTFGFAGGSVVFGTRFDGVSLDGFMVTFPPLTGADPPTGGGSLSLPMAGPAVGCVRFDALINRFPPLPAGARVDDVSKTLVHVQIDPLHPFDPTRTFQTFTDRNFLLRRTADGVRLIPAPAGA